MFENTLASALHAKKNNNLEKWIHFFLTTGSNTNIPFSLGLKKEKRFFIGPIKLPLSNFKRICGPEKDMLYQVNEEYFNSKVSNMMIRIEEGWDVPPIIFELKDDELFLNDGNHRFEAFLRLSISEYYVILWCSEHNKPKLHELVDRLY